MLEFLLAASFRRTPEFWQDSNPPLVGDSSSPLTVDLSGAWMNIGGKKISS